ncbi:MAG: hypothetical protein KAV45_12270 [Calditrichia bacterium]|nr:hypothetical protein [Calditrichia bacterium]
MVFFRFIIVGLLILSIAACGDKEQNKTATVETDTQKQAIKTETSSDMPELWEFHEVIYQIWHEAWPEKNTVMLKDLIPEIEAGFAKLEQASLPGILRDKQEAWTKGIQDMAGIIETYKKTAVADEKEALLKAAEDLHSQFELLVRLIRPVMKEIDRFHQELYMLYHYYMPDYDLQKISASAAELIVRMDPIEKAQLPARLKDKQQVYEQAKIALREALKQLQQTIKDEAQKDQVVKAVEVVHDKYQLLVGVFE